MISPQRRIEILDALRRGTVPRRGLEAFAVGMDRFEGALTEELKQVASGGSVFKAVRGEYGCGKTFLARWLQDRAQREGFVTAEVQISETETPLHRLETVYRRLIERLSSTEGDEGVFRALIDGWFFALEEDVLAGGTTTASAPEKLLEQTDELLETRLAAINRVAPAFCMALRGYRGAQAGGEFAVADGLLAWLGGQPNVGMKAKRAAGIKGDVDHFLALGFLQGLLAVLRDSGRPGLVVVLDEVETLQRMRGDVRDKALNALRQLMDEIDSRRFPGLYLVITGTPAFFDSPQGIQRLPPLAQRLHVDFNGDPKFDNPRAVQLRLKPFDLGGLVEVGSRVRDIFAEGSSRGERIRQLVDQAFLDRLAGVIAGKLGGKVGIAPRIFLKKLVSDILDKIDQYPEFDPGRDYSPALAPSELNEAEDSARPAGSVDDINIKV
jgi:type II secretory pathway predicted ATPase ExeA